MRLRWHDDKGFIFTNKPRRLSVEDLTMKIRMIKTLAPDDIPNGSIGYIKDEEWENEYLRVKLAEFDNDMQALVYKDEVEVVGE